MNAARPPLGKPRRARRARGAFTLAELLVAVGLAALVLAAMCKTFIWAFKKATYAAHVSWSENEAIRSSRDLVGYVRNAQALSSVDTNGFWVNLLLTNNAAAHIEYVNPTPHLRNGYIVRSNLTSHATMMVVSQGVTKIMTTGFSPPVFQQVKSNSLSICYRVVEPIAADPGQYNDMTIAAIVDTVVCLRNAAH